MSIVEFDGPPSWSFDANETGENRRNKTALSNLLNIQPEKCPGGEGGYSHKVWIGVCREGS